MGDIKGFLKVKRQTFAYSCVSGINDEPVTIRKVDFIKPENNVCPVMQEIPGTEFEIEADLVILALGFLYPEKKGLIEELGVALDSRGNVKTNENYMSSINGVFSCGNMRRGQSLIVQAISEGRRAAYCIDKYLMGKTYLSLI